MFTITRILRASEGGVFTIIRNLHHFEGPVIQAPPFDVVCRRLAPLVFRGAVPFLPTSGKFLEHIEVLGVGPKSAPLKTSRLITSRL